MKRTCLFLLTFLVSCNILIGCQVVQEQTNKEAPNQKTQKEGRSEIKKDKQIKGK